MSEELLKAIHSDVKEIREQTINLVKQGAIHNEVLTQHEKRSTQLEVRVDPLEKDLVFRQQLLSAGIGVLGVVGAVAGFLKTLNII